VLSLTHAVLSYLIVRRYFPKQRLIHLLAPGLVLFLPVLIYSAPFLGNEGIGAVLSSISLFVLLGLLERPSFSRSLVLGICLGLSMLAKFTGMAVGVGAVVALGLQAYRRGELKAGAMRLALAMTVMLAICGWYYGRNVIKYGTPFKMSRDEFMVQHVEHIQTKGNRGLLDYLTFDPVILLRPQFPRGLPLTGTVPPDAVRSVIREGVWTGMYANTWFDGFGGWVLPQVFGHEFSRRAGQILLTLGLIPTFIMMLGMLVAIRQLWRKGWDDTLVAMLGTFVAMLLIFIQGTRVAPLHAAVKATYFVPIAVVFSFWFALGLSQIAAFRPRWLRYIAAECTVLALVSTGVFTQGLLVKPYFGDEGPIAEAIWGDLKGVVYYAAGDRPMAKELFQKASNYGYHLGFENLATLALEEGRSLEALYLLRRAAAIQPLQSFGIPQDRYYFDQITQAEYQNSMAVIYSRLGWTNEALNAARAAGQMDPSMPVGHYNAGVLELLRVIEESHDGKAPESSEPREVRIRRAQLYFGRSLQADPGYVYAWGMLGVTQALLGDCAGALDNLEKAVHPPRWLRPEFPEETGRGMAHAAAIGRRKRITELPDVLQAGWQRQHCSAAAS
jgi:tetratricopeptide (TPR) repeat protein